jgi:predicted AAA+ superfamily ATPase
MARRKKPKRFSKNIVLDTIIKVFILIWFGMKYLAIGMYKFFKWIVHLIVLLIDKIKEKREKKQRELDEIEEETKVKELNKKPKKKNQRIKRFKVIENLEGSILKFEHLLRSNKSSIGIILGARGKGKSALGMRLLENIHYSTGKRCVAMGFEAKTLPRWINVIDDIQDIPTDSVILIDEGGILFSSRDSMSDANKMLSSLLLVARHKDVSVVFISQNSSNLELNAIRQADYILLKPSSLLQKDFERQKIKQIYSEVSEKFGEYEKFLGLTYVYSDVFRGFVTNDLPSFWNENVSKAFRKK